MEMGRKGKSFDYKSKYCFGLLFRGLLLAAQIVYIILNWEVERGDCILILLVEEVSYTVSFSN